MAEWPKLLLDPTLPDIQQALAAVQRRARSHCLSDAEAAEAWRRVLQGNEPHAAAGMRPCPPGFRYGVTSTVIQVARLHDGLVGCAIGRRAALPGDAGQAPIVSDPYGDPRRWLKQVLQVFWTALDEEQLAAVEQWAVTAALAIAAAQGPARRGSAHGDARVAGRRSAVRRRLQLATLFRAAQPIAVSELSGALQRIAGELRTEGSAHIGWRHFQQRWPSLAMRHKRALLPLFGAKTATPAAIAAHADVAAPPRYRLRFTTWSGLQTLFAGTQLVFQVCSPLLGPGERCDAAHAALARKLQRAAERSPHPATPQTVGWLRVHVDDLQRLVFIDEVQSDVLEWLRQSALDGEPAARGLMDHLADWHFEGFSAVHQWAAAIGYRVGLHSEASAMSIPGKTPSARKWNTCYAALVKRFALTLETVPGYPAPIHAESR